MTQIVEREKHLRVDERLREITVHVHIIPLDTRLHDGNFIYL
jgi:hypothetical protein